MPTSFAGRSGPMLARTPSHRQQAQRRRLSVLCAIVALALASGVIGSLIGKPAAPPAASPAFHYFPTP